MKSYIYFKLNFLCIYLFLSYLFPEHRNQTAAFIDYKRIIRHMRDIFRLLPRNNFQLIVNHVKFVQNITKRIK